MFRRLIATISVCSLLLCVAVCVVWVQSYWVVDELTYTGERSRYILATADGRFDLVFHEEGEPFGRALRGWSGSHFADWGLGRASWRKSVSSPKNPFIETPREPFLGFWWGTLNEIAGPESGFTVIGPVLPAALPFVILAAPWVVRRAVQARRDRCERCGRCRSCGYDLTGNVSGVCPECGTPLPPSAARHSQLPAAR